MKLKLISLLLVLSVLLIGCNNEKPITENITDKHVQDQVSKKENVNFNEPFEIIFNKGSSEKYLEEQHAVVSISEFKDYEYHSDRAVSFKVEVENTGSNELRLQNFLGIFKLITGEGVKIGFEGETHDHTLDHMASILPKGKTSFIFSYTIKTDRNLTNLLITPDFHTDNSDTYIFDFN